ncbi:PIF1-like helicase-domain-containing protein, partial [Catenaria anguillulae PL171]
HQRTIDDCDVVAYNPTLLKKYEAHINVEICCDARVFHYMFKYIFKGPAHADVAVLAGEQIRDEIKEYIRCPRSFENLRTVNGNTLPTFHEAARGLGLVTDDNEWELVMQEAIRARNCADGVFNDGSRFAFRTPRSPRTAHYQLILTPVLHLTQLGFELGDIRVPDDVELYHASVDKDTAAAEFRGALDAIARNPDQSLAFAALQSAIDYALLPADAMNDDARACTYFVQGSSGRGKTFLLNHVINYIIMSGGIVLTCAFTGIAASSLKLGRTAHSTFNISINRDDLGRITCRVTRNSKRGRLLRAAHVLIWDELGMMDNAGIEAVDRLLRDVRECDSPFGGIVFIGCGDLKQLAPVVPRSTHEDVIAAS